MLNLRYQSQFKKDLKVMQKRQKNMNHLKEVIEMLCEEKELPEKFCDHALSGEYSGYRDCHIQNDWLLIYKIDKESSLISLYRTGTHSDLFK
ncbi:MAG: type II toxin-antitoxin system YafQ family toxin [Holosporales bacterium]|nr:type II toxin-antitoxin system YafQ family toxin [Holosporales bacterium]